MKSTSELLRSVISLIKSLLPALPKFPPQADKSPPKSARKGKSSGGKSSSRNAGSSSSSSSATLSEGDAVWKENEELFEKFAEQLVSAVLTTALTSIDANVRMDSMQALCRSVSMNKILVFGLRALETQHNIHTSFVCMRCLNTFHHFVVPALRMFALFQQFFCCFPCRGISR